MYSYDDRLRDVQLYIKLDKRVRLTIRQLGYPTKNALKAWHQTYEQRQALPAGYVREPKYTPAQKQLAVEHFAANGCCLAFTIKALGHLSRSLLAGWVRRQPLRIQRCHREGLRNTLRSVCWGQRLGSEQAGAEAGDSWPLGPPAHTSTTPRHRSSHSKYGGAFAARDWAGRRVTL